MSSTSFEKTDKGPQFGEPFLFSSLEALPNLGYLKAMKLELVINLSLQASHSLEEREEPHSHRWDIQVGLVGDLESGRIVSLTKAQELFSSALAPLQDTFLNNNNHLDPETKACPTCENLAFFLLSYLEAPLKQLNTKAPPKLSFIQVGLWEEGVQLGFAKLSV